MLFLKLFSHWFLLHLPSKVIISLKKKFVPSLLKLCLLMFMSEEWTVNTIVRFISSCQQLCLSLMGMISLLWKRPSPGPLGEEHSLLLQCAAHQVFDPSNKERKRSIYITQSGMHTIHIWHFSCSFLKLNLWTL